MPMLAAASADRHNAGEAVDYGRRERSSFGNRCSLSVLPGRATLPARRSRRFRRGVFGHF